MFASTSSSFSALAAAVLLLATASTASASAHKKSTFAVLHFYGDGPLVEGRMDPVISPGIVSGHVHTVQGGNAFNLSMGNNFASKATCTTARVNADKSNYWTPKLYFKSPTNGTFYDVPLYYANIYYFFDNTDDDLVPFPPGFRMVSGDPNLRSPPAGGPYLQLDASKGPIQPVSWVCPRKSTNPPAWPKDSKGWPIGMQSNVVGEGVGFPNQDCDGLYSPLRANIHFPSCITKDQSIINDYTRNTAWPSVNNQTHNWNCPAGYSHVPHLFHEYYWNTQLFSGQWTPGKDSQPFVLAQGDPTGYGLHADFISGWDTAALQYTIDNCNAGDSGMDQCTGIPGGTVKSGSIDCHVKTPFSEKITGPLKALPGCNAIQAGPGKAVMNMNCNNPAVTGPFPGGIATGQNTGVAATGTSKTTLKTSSTSAKAAGTSITAQRIALPTTTQKSAASAKGTSSSATHKKKHKTTKKKKHQHHTQGLTAAADKDANLVAAGKGGTATPATTAVAATSTTKKHTTHHHHHSTKKHHHKVHHKHHKHHSETKTTHHTSKSPSVKEASSNDDDDDDEQCDNNDKRDINDDDDADDADEFDDEWSFDERGAVIDDDDNDAYEKDDDSEVLEDDGNDDRHVLPRRVEESHQRMRRHRRVAQQGLF